jgi:two-component system phosphate regulon sensor histidine kinase PhoR
VVALRKNLFKYNLLLNTTILLITVLSIGVVTFTRLEAHFFHELEKELVLIESIYQKDGITQLESLATSDRITLIAKDGTVLFDSESDKSTMDNHNNRPEVKEARAAKDGLSKRESSTILSKSFYYAKLLNNGEVLRLSITENSFMSLYLQIIFSVASIFLLLIVLTFFATKRLAKKMIQPINKINLDDPTKSVVYPELRPLITRLSEQNQKIAEQLEHLAYNEQQLNLITNNMEEGLILLDQQNRLLIANPIAKNVFQIEASDFQKTFSKSEKIPKLMTILENMAEEKNGELLFKLDEATYRVWLNAVFKEEKYIGTVLFVFDITKTASQEELRAEFTANVTHELKTPLTSISGYAEIMHAGIVKPADVTRFAGKIHTEAQRLLELINDTLKLSHLEHTENLAKDPLELTILVNQVLQSLQLQTTKRHQSVKLASDVTFFAGYKSVMQDILYNLIENASKYSGENSHILISLQQFPETIRLTVCDDGPGIPPKEVGRVFERFYRGDKSHSSQIPGTGLGLAIVKHGVLLHRGTIKVENIKPHGTKFSIELPI